VAEAEAVRLFVARAQAVVPGFAVTAENAWAVAEVCRRLDGLPLALELAATRLTLLTPAGLLARMDGAAGGLSLLAGGPRDVPPRQQSLGATIAWSDGLLAPAERALFRRLAVFSGGCTLESAEAVVSVHSPPRRGPARPPRAGDPHAGDGCLDVLEGLQRLVDLHLLRRETGPDGEARFGMLRTVREYATARLAEHGEADPVREAHAVHFLALCEAAAPQLKGPAQRRWLDRLEREHDNVRAALAWWRGRGEAERALRLALAVERFWEVHGHIVEGRGWLESLLPAGGGRRRRGATTAWQRLRGRGLSVAGNFAFYKGEWEAMRALQEQGLAIAGEVGDRAGIAYALHGLGMAAARQGDLVAARRQYLESLAAARETGDGWAVARALHRLGALTRDEGELDGARALFELGLASARAAGERRIAALLLNSLAGLARRQGALDRADRRYQESLLSGTELGDRFGVAEALLGLGEVALDRGDLATARVRLRESLATMWSLGAMPDVMRCLEGFAALAGAEGRAERALRLDAAAGRLRAALALDRPNSLRRPPPLERALEAARRVLYLSHLGNYMPRQVSQHVVLTLVLV
jgi:tetratricopeptide (TPR) repeat protein